MVRKVKKEKVLDSEELEFSKILEEDFFKELSEDLDYAMDKDIDDIGEQMALELVEEAYDLGKAKGKKKIIEALYCSTDCIDVYLYLGVMENSPEIAMIFYEKGVLVGEKKFDKKFEKENRGDYWSIIETRPYMRCLYNYAQTLLFTDRDEEYMDVLEKILKLNSNDNMGVRYELMNHLIGYNNEKKFKKYAKEFEGDGSTSMLFILAMNKFKNKGDVLEARKLLEKAMNSNKFVLKMLTEKNFKSEFPVNLNFYSLGSKEEAYIYVEMSRDLWWAIDGAIEWLETFKKD